MTQKISVLYVDDEPALLDVASHFLERSGQLSITTLGSAQKALDLLKKQSFDVIVSDYQMPAMDGIEFLKEIRQHFDGIPFILFTGKGREEVVIEALNSGADSYIQKGSDTKAQFAELEQKIRVHTEHRQAQLALSESEKKYRELVENAQECIYIIQDEKFVFYNPKFAECLMSYGYLCDEFSSLSFLSFIHPDDQAVMRDRYFRRITRDEKFSRYPFRALNRSGEIRWWEVDAIRIVWNGRPATLNFGRDITEEYQLREQLKESEKTYRALVETLPKTVIEFDKELALTFINRAGREKFGYPDKTCTGPVSALDLVCPDERLRVREIYLQAFSGNYPQVHEAIAQKSDGSTFPMEVYLTPIVKKKKVNGFRVLCIDISRAKNLQDRLVQANTKLNRMCQITRHDFNNKVIALMGYLDLARERAGDDEIVQYLQKIGAIVGILEAQVQFTKSYQEIGQYEPKWQDLSTAIARSRAALAFGKINLAIDTEGVEIYADMLLEKVFYNLFDNSRSHGEYVTSISISYRNTGQSLDILYEDNGVGISAEDKPRLFTCGFGKHTGLGLFLSKEILATTGITIHETGEFGKGARFEITVPQGSFRIVTHGIEG